MPTMDEIIKQIISPVAALLGTLAGTYIWDARIKPALDKAMPRASKTWRAIGYAIRYLSILGSVVLVWVNVESGKLFSVLIAACFSVLVLMVCYDYFNRWINRFIRTVNKQNEEELLQKIEDARAAKKHSVVSFYLEELKALRGGKL